MATEAQLLAMSLTPFTDNDASITSFGKWDIKEKVHAGIIASTLT